MQHNLQNTSSVMTACIGDITFQTTCRLGSPINLPTQPARRLDRQIGFPKFAKTPRFLSEPPRNLSAVRVQQAGSANRFSNPARNEPAPPEHSPQSPPHRGPPASSPRIDFVWRPGKLLRQAVRPTRLADFSAGPVWVQGACKPPIGNCVVVRTRGCGRGRGGPQYAQKGRKR